MYDDNFCLFLSGRKKSRVLLFGSIELQFDTPRFDFLSNFFSATIKKIVLIFFYAILHRCFMQFFECKICKQNYFKKNNSWLKNKKIDSLIFFKKNSLVLQTKILHAKVQSFG